MKKAVAFSFCRMNPPTIGHEILVNGLIALAASGNADHIIYLSQSQNSVTDPIPFELKKRFVSASFPTANISSDAAIKTPFDALHKLSQEYEDIVLYVGEDRVQEFVDRMTPYAKKWDIKNFAVMSAGKRNPRARNATGASATKLRNLALRGKDEEFYRGLPNRLNSKMKKQAYQLTLKGLVKPVQRRKA